MSKITINSDVMMSSLKIYSINGEIFADIVGMVNTDIGPISLNFPTAKLDFESPGQTDLGGYAFMDGKGRVGYEFNFGDVIFKFPDDESEGPDAEQQDVQVDQSEEDASAEK